MPSSATSLVTSAPARRDLRKQLYRRERQIQKPYDWICDRMRDLELAPFTVILWPLLAGIGILAALPLVFWLEAIHAEQAQLDQ